MEALADQNVSDGDVHRVPGELLVLGSASGVHHRGPVGLRPLPVHLVLGVVGQTGVGQLGGGVRRRRLDAAAVEFQEFSSTAMPRVEMLGSTTV